MKSIIKDNVAWQLSHNACYVLTNGVKDELVGYAVYDTFTCKYFTPKCGWSRYISNADLLPKSVINDVFPGPRYFPHPVFESYNNVCARRGYRYA